MTVFNTYQIALVVVLVLNLVFWILVICFRLFFQFPCGNDDNQLRRRRIQRRPLQDRRNSSNRSLMGNVNGGFGGEDGMEPYSINGSLEAPPSYEDAIKHSTIMISQRMLPQSYLGHQQEGPSQARRPMVYEQSVVLMVPEESTSISETRLTTSLDGTSDEMRRSSVAAQATAAVGLPAMNASNGHSSIMQECSALNSADDSATLDDDGSITFIVGDTEAPRVHMTCSTRNVLQLEDGKNLSTHTQA